MIFQSSGLNMIVNFTQLAYKIQLPVNYYLLILTEQNYLCQIFFLQTRQIKLIMIITFVVMVLIHAGLAKQFYLN